MGCGVTDLTTLEREWDDAAKAGAFFNILTIPDFSEGDFWEHGNAEINAMLAELAPRRRRAALDFGCGIGRLTQPLAKHFRRVVGVDLSSEMLRLARRHNNEPNVEYVHSNARDLARFQDNEFDLVYSTIVLQHMCQEFARGYVQEFLRVTRAGGLVVFQLPEGPDIASDRSWLSMYGTSPATVEEWVAGHGLVDVSENDAAGGTMRSWRYAVRA